MKTVITAANDEIKYATRTVGYSLTMDIYTGYMFMTINTV